MAAARLLKASAMIFCLLFALCFPHAVCVSAGASSMVHLAGDAESALSGAATPFERSAEVFSQTS